MQTRVPGFGGTDTVEYLDPSLKSETKYFYDIAEKLSQLGLKRGKHVTFFVSTLRFSFPHLQQSQNFSDTQEFPSAERRMISDSPLILLLLGLPTLLI